jgi:cytolysin (calcineurin-like family phosphatase)
LKIYLVTEDQLIRLEASVWGAQFQQVADLKAYQEVIAEIKNTVQSQNDETGSLVLRQIAAINAIQRRDGLKFGPALASCKIERPELFPR